MAGYCVLEFASLAELLAVGEAPSTPDTRSCLSAVLDAANACTDSLTVIVRVSSDSVNPWQPAAPSSSSAGAVVGAAPLAHPTALFLPLERALARLYSVPTDSFVARDLVTAATTVVLEQLRNSPVCVPDSAHLSARWNADQPGRAVTASDDDKGKARQAVDQEPAPQSGSDALRAPSATSLPRLFDVVALGGTFDHLHSGHKILLTMAASITARKLIVGVSGQSSPPPPPPSLQSTFPLSMTDAAVLAPRRRRPLDQKEIPRMARTSRRADPPRRRLCRARPARDRMRMRAPAGARPATS